MALVPLFFYYIQGLNSIYYTSGYAQEASWEGGGTIPQNSYKPFQDL